MNRFQNNAIEWMELRKNVESTWDEQTQWTLGLGLSHTHTQGINIYIVYIKRAQTHFSNSGTNHMRGK